MNQKSHISNKKNSVNSSLTTVKDSNPNQVSKPNDKQKAIKI